MAGVTLNAGTIAIGCGAGMATCLIAVVLPQFTVTSMARFHGDWLRGSRDAGGPGQAPVRAALVVCQVALALALVAGAGLLVRTVRHLSATPLGFDAPQVVTVQATLPMPGYREPARQVEFDRAVLDRLAQLPGVQSVAMGAPLTGGMGASLSIFGQAQPEGRPEVTYFPISPGFLATLGIPLKEGRDLQATDTRDSERVVVINETMARQFWPRGDAIGSRVRLGPSTDAPWITIVGIVGDVRQHGVLQAVRPTSYGSTAQYFFPSRHYSLRVQHPPASIAADIRAVLRSIDPAVPVGAVSGLDEIVRRQLARQRLAMWVLTGFGVTALVLCGFGVYGVASLTSRLRRREFAIRAALGARPSRIRWIVVRQALVLAGLGSAGGLGIAVAGTRLLAGLLHGVRPIDRPSFVAATAAVWLLAAFAAWYPARHAGRVDPLQALKHD
jgi:predicted permease